MSVLRDDDFHRPRRAAVAHAKPGILHLENRTFGAAGAQQRRLALRRSRPSGPR